MGGGGLWDIAANMGIELSGIGGGGGGQRERKGSEKKAKMS